MMGPVQRTEPKLFYTGLNLEDRIRDDHPLRAIASLIDFEFVREQVAPLYGDVGNPSVDPIVVLKLIFLLFYESVPSERELAARLGERLDWLWFCGYDLDSELPNHSVLSKARRRWGKELFITFFERVVQQCVDQGLVKGSTVYVDGSVIAANASKDSLTAALRLRGQKVYQDLEEACEEAGEETGEKAGDMASEQTCDEACEEPREEPCEKACENAGETASEEAPLPATPISSTDPEARLTRKNGQTILGYKDHRVVDDGCGIITVTVTTDAATPEADQLAPALQQHERNTGKTVQTVAADKGYGTAAVYRQLQEQQITPCIPHKQPTEAAEGKFRRCEFKYDAESDSYVCPAGERLLRRGPASDARYRYQAAPGVCARCPLRERCTENQRGRLLSRHVDQDVIDWADGALPAGRRRELMRRRKYKMEGSFADAANRHGYKRARWRGLIGATIQNLLIATVQNIRKLVRHTPLKPGPATITALARPKAVLARPKAIAVACSSLQERRRIQPVTRWALLRLHATLHSMCPA